MYVSACIYVCADVTVGGQVGTCVHGVYVYIGCTCAYVFMGCMCTWGVRVHVFVCFSVCDFTCAHAHALCVCLSVFVFVCVCVCVCARVHLHE